LKPRIILNGEHKECNTDIEEPTCKRIEQACLIISWLYQVTGRKRLADNVANMIFRIDIPVYEMMRAVKCIAHGDIPNIKM